VFIDLQPEMIRQFEMISDLMEMGFTAQQAEAALQLSNNQLVRKMTLYPAS
jgi:hypothetical protein